MFILYSQEVFHRPAGREEFPHPSQSQSQIAQRKTWHIYPLDPHYFWEALYLVRTECQNLSSPIPVRP